MEKDASPTLIILQQTHTIVKTKSDDKDGLPLGEALISVLAVRLAREDKRYESRAAAEGGRKEGEEKKNGMKRAAPGQLTGDKIKARAGLQEGRSSAERH